MGSNISQRGISSVNNRVYSEIANLYVNRAFHCRTSVAWIVVHVAVDYYLDNNLDVVDEWKLRKMVTRPARLKYIFIGK